MYGPPLCRKRKMRVTGWSVGRLVCADVYALGWSTELLALMECAEPSSYLGTQSRKTFPVCRFRERRVRPLSHLMVRQQTWQKHQLVSSWAVGVGLASGFLPVSLPKTPRIEFLFLCPGLCPMHLRSRLATSRPELGPMRPIKRNAVCANGPREPFVLMRMSGGLGKLRKSLTCEVVL